LPRSCESFPRALPGNSIAGLFSKLFKYSFHLMKGMGLSQCIKDRNRDGL